MIFGKLTILIDFIILRNKLYEPYEPRPAVLRGGAGRGRRAF